MFQASPGFSYRNVVSKAACGSPTLWVSPHISPQLVHPPEICWCCVGWPTSLTGGERPGGSEFGDLKGRKEFSTYSAYLRRF